MSNPNNPNNPNNPATLDKGVPYVVATGAEAKALQGLQSLLLATYPIIGALAVNERIYYRIVDIPNLAPAFTDGIWVFINRQGTGQRGTPKYIAPMLTLHKPYPDPSGSVKTLESTDPASVLPPMQAAFILAHEVLHIMRGDPAAGFQMREAGHVHIPRIGALPEVVYADKNSIQARLRMGQGGEQHNTASVLRETQRLLKFLHSKFPDGMAPTKAAPGTPHAEKWNQTYRGLLNDAMDCAVNTALILDGCGVMPTNRPLPTNASPEDAYTTHPWSDSYGSLGGLHPLINHLTSLPLAYCILLAELLEKMEQEPQHGGFPSRAARDDMGGGMGGDMLNPGAGGDPDQEAEEAAKSAQDGQRGGKGPGKGPVLRVSKPLNPSQAAQQQAQQQGGRSAMLQSAQSLAERMGREGDRRGGQEAGQGSSATLATVHASTAPPVDWRAYAEGFLARKTSGGTLDWNRASRSEMVRGLAAVGATLGSPESMARGYFTPARGGHAVGALVMAGDTSGSIRDEYHRKMLAAMADIFEAYNPERTVLIWCDDRVQRVDDVDRDTDFASYEVPKGGGTCFKPPFEWVAKNLNDRTGHEKPDVMIYFTDLDGAFPPEPDYPVLWLSITKGLKAPFGETIYVDVSTL